MTIRNPIDQRHANRKDTDCPVFWRRIGIPIAWLLALYPWSLVVCSIVLLRIDHYAMTMLIQLRRIPAPVWESICVYHGKTQRLTDVLLFAGGYPLLPIAIGRYIFMAIAVRRGLVRTRTFVACIVTAVLPILLLSQLKHLIHRCPWFR